MIFVPVLHEQRCEAVGVSFTDEHVTIEMADGRVIGIPLRFFPLLEAASDEERQNCDLHVDTVYWEDIDDGIDLTALLTGLYIEPSQDYLQSLKEQIAGRARQLA